MRSVSDQVKFTDVEPGTKLAQESYRVTRLSLVKYCGASGDFNVIHWNETDWAGDQAALQEFGVRFSSPVVVPDDDTGASIEISGTIEEKLDGNRVVLALTARSGADKVLTRARAVVRLP